MQKMMESPSKPVIHLLLRFLEIVKQELRMLYSGVSRGSDFKIMNAHARKMEGYTVGQLDRIRIGI